MGRSFSASSGKNVLRTGLDGVVRAEFLRTAGLNATLKGEVIKTAGLNGDVSLFTRYELFAGLDAYLAPATTLGNGLVSYWKLDGNSTDAVGSNNGTDTAITYSVGNGKIGQGAGGNGAGSRINVGSANLNLLDVSISIWVKPTTDDYHLWVTRLVGNGVGQNTYELRMVPGRTVGMAGVGAVNVLSAAPLTLGVWSHVVATRAASGFTRIYVNGTLSGSGAGAVPTSLPSQPTLIGTRDDNYNFLNHPIDEVGIWNRVLTAAEVSELYNRSVGIQYPFAAPLPMSTGTISYWKLDGDSTDSLGVANGTDTAVTYSGANGKINSGGGFNGSSSKIVLPQLAAYKPSNFTVSAWVKTTASGYQEVFESYNQSGTPAGFEFRQNGSSIELVLGNGSTYTITTGSRPINTGNWTHVAATYDGATVRLYVNGNPDSTGTNATGVAYTGDTRVRIGVNNYTGGTETYFFNGSIDEVGFWDRPFTGVEIEALYNKGVGQQYPFMSVAPISTSLVSYWKLDGNSTDAVGSNNGTDTAITYSVGNGKINQGAGFNGTSSKIVLGGISLSAQWSVSLWMNPASNVDHPLFLNSTGNPGFYLKANGTTDWFNGSSNFGSLVATTGVWNHFVVTYDGATVRRYLNGVEDASATTAGAFTLTNFGWNGFALFAVGAMDEIGVWTRRLTSAEVTALYSAGAGIQYPF